MHSLCSDTRNPTWGRRILLTILIAILTTVSGIAGTRASSGFPNSSEFGYGIRIRSTSSQYENLIRTASEVGLDWVAVDFNWSQVWPHQANPPSLQELDQIMAAARSNRVNVSLAITRAPDWAMTAEGPDPGLTANFVQHLVNRYPENNMAIELFPGANTIRGWGTSPNPVVYKQILASSMEAISPDLNRVVIVAAGLTPRGQNSPDGDWDDLEYLKALYSVGAAQVMPIVGIRLEEVTGDPLAPPETRHATYSLRHYEKVRQTMLDQGHRNGLIWITGFSSSTSANHQEKSTSTWTTYQDQLNWIARAYHQIKSQLYIGAAFFDSASLTNNSFGSSVAIKDDGLIDETQTALSTEIAFIKEMTLVHPSNENTIIPEYQPKVSKNESYKKSLKPLVP